MLVSTAKHFFKGHGQTINNIKHKQGTCFIQSFTIDNDNGLAEFLKKHPKFDAVNLHGKPGIAVYRIGTGR